MSEWQPIETAPRDGTKLLGYEGDGRINTMWFESQYVWVSPGAWISDYNRSDTYEHQPTHWMPLPEPPQ